MKCNNYNMEKKVLLKKLVDGGTHLRTDFTPTAIVSDFGARPIGEFWDANKTIDVIVNGAHAVHDTVRELDEFTEGEVRRLDNVKVSRIGWDDNNPITDVKALTNSQINSLKTGDTVIKTTGNEKHSYTVVYKKDDEMSLVYADRWTVEEVYYEKQNGNWTYIQTDTFKPENYYTKQEMNDKLDDILGVNANDIEALRSIIDDLDDETGVLGAIASKQDELVSGTNIKTISGQSILGAGNIDIQATVTANEQMPASWLNNTSTMTQLINKINADDSVQKGKVYLSTVSLNDLPADMMQAEMKVEVMGKQSGKWILVFTISSANTSPYRWEYSSYNEQNGPWRSWIPTTTTLGTASSKDVAASGDASTTQVVMGDDSRLTDARTPVAHTHTVSDITDFPNAVTSTTSGLKIEVVAAMPANPDTNTIYIVQ